MVHYAGYTPRFHPSDFATRCLDGVGADWPITYDELRAPLRTGGTGAAGGGAGLAMAGTSSLPALPHPSPVQPAHLAKGPNASGIRMRAVPVGITNGVFGNRPHCIYRGYCLQGCKVNAKASPYVTHLPDALAHAIEIRAGCMATRSRSTRPAAGPSAWPTSATANGSSGWFGPGWWRWPATPSRRRACCSTPPRPGSRTGWATTTIKSAAT